MSALEKPPLYSARASGAGIPPRFSSTPAGNTDDFHDAGSGGDISHATKLNILAMLHAAESLLIKGELDRVTNILETVANMTRPRQ